MTAPIRLTVIDGHPLFREGVVAMLLAVDGIEVVAEGATAGDALKITQERAPDVMLLDILVPGGAIEAASELARVHQNMRIIILTASEDEKHVAAALEAGAQGYILKRSTGREIVQAVRAVARGELYVTPNLGAQLLSKKNDRVETVADDGNPHGLTSREAEVFALVARGMSNREIARAFSCTERTIKNHMTNIMHKLGVRNRLEAVLTVRADGIKVLQVKKRRRVNVQSKSKKRSRVNVQFKPTAEIA
jgi:two-component system, NarL family, nitrate/nitrite response regulator NarL